MNFKGVQTLWEKSSKLTKILSQHGIHKSGFSWAHLYAKFHVPTQASKLSDSKIRNKFELKFKLHGTYNTTKRV
jgi:hypothetical protein